MAGEILDIEALAPRLPRHARLIGVDPGSKLIGLALSDVERRFASPLGAIRRTRFKADAAHLLEHVVRHEAAALVIGLPFNMDGSEGPRAQAARAFARNLAALGAPPIVFWDERLSTVAVTRTLIEQDFSRARRAGMVDKMAAAHILQGALDRLARIAGAR